MATNYNYFQPTQNDSTGTPPVNPYSRTLPFQMPQQIFPQASGAAYLINSSSELQNIPITSGISVVICFPENILYLKAFQNGSPATVAYRLSAFESIATRDSKTEDSLAALIQNFESRLKKLEENNTKKEGGKLNELL